MSISAKDLAQYIRETVCFDFSKETISSYEQIRRRHEDFYAVEDTHAFSALLNDIIGKDNQQIDVFVDLQMADRGFRFFANKENRENPYIAVSAFLCDQRFQYHRQEIGKVYFAINTWLCFFGAKEIDALWDECPICTGKISGGACTTSKCKKKQSEFLPIMIELQGLLEDETKGIEVVLPKYYQMITPKAQFGVYKLKIDELREARSKRLAAEKKKQQQKLIILAETELKKIEARLQIEEAKEEPKFDMLLSAINSNVAIVDALRCDERSFKTKVDKLVKSIEKGKEAWNLKKEGDRLKGETDVDFKEFVMLKTKVENEVLYAKVMPPYSEAQAIINAADKLYHKVYTVSIKYPNIFTQSEKDVLLDYRTNIKPEVISKIKVARHDETLDDAKDNLMLILGELEKEYERCKNLKDGAQELWERFVNEVEKNEVFIDCREDKAWDKHYIELTDPLKRKIENLLKAQIDAKTNALLGLTEPLRKELACALPKHKKARKLRDSLIQIQKNPYFFSIQGSAVYKKENSYLDEVISKLEREELDYFRRKRKKIRILSVSLVLLSVMLYSLFAYIIPSMQIDFITRENNNGKYEVVGIKDAKTETLVIAERLPHYFLKKNKTVVAIAENAFLGNTVLKKCVIPASVERIESGAFSACTSLSTVILQSANPPSVHEGAFERYSVVFLVPAESYAAYLQAQDWQVYKDSIFPFYENDESVCMVMFDSQGGSPVQAMHDLKLNTLVDPLPTPEKFGYSFDGWYYYNATGDETRMECNEAIFKKSTKLFAKWSQGVYRVDFEYNDGSGRKETGEVTFGNAWGEMPVPSRKGYSFDGWYRNGERVGEADVVNVATDTVLLAQWTPLQYAVSFDYAGGTEVSDGTTVTFDSAYESLPIPTRIGYVFGGWKLGGVTVNENTVVYIAEDHTLVADWIANAYTIRYELNGGLVVGDTTVICRYDEETTLASPTRTGYRFAYWECNGVRYDAGQSVLNLSSVSGELVFEAYWQPIRYTITYETDGGTVLSNTVSCVYDQDVAIATPTKTGYTLLYWACGPRHIAAGEIVNNLSRTDGEEIVLRAIWKANEYTIQYLLAGGTQAVLSVDCVYNLPVVLETPTREGYLFLHWQLGSNTFAAGQSVENLTALNGGTVELVAVWKAKENELIFDKNLGEGEMASVAMASNSTSSLPLNTFTRAGYTFIGWSREANGAVEYADGASYTMGTSPTNTLYAVWTANTNTLVLVANNGTEDRLEYSLKTNETMRLPTNTFLRTGYVFAGWRTPNGVTVEYTDEATYIMPADTVSILLAVWTPLDNKLVFDKNGGNGVEVSQLIPSNDTRTLISCSYTRDGYRFAGWSNTSNGEVNYLDGGNYTMGIEPEVRLYAVWKIVNYDILYELDGGENSPENKTNYTVHSGTILLHDPSKPGYTFEGWYTDAAKTVKISQFDASLLATVKLYANWIANSNSLVFHPGDGGGTMKTLQIETGSTVILPACEFVRVGYEFMGWSTSLGGDVYYLNSAEYKMGIQSEYVLYAVWEKAIYSIDYHMNGGVNHADNPMTYHIESMDITLGVPTRIGYTFGGWYAESTMTTSPVMMIAAGSYGNQTLYAKWIAKENTLRFDANGGVGSMDEITLKTGEMLVSLPAVTFEKEGYNFAGWALTAHGNSIYGDGASFEMGTAEVVTLYAVWTDFAYSISYNLNGGTNHQQNPVGYKIGSATITLQPPTRAGYTFGGWYTDISLKHKIVEIKSGSTGHVVIYARWTANQNTLIFDANGGTGVMSDLVISTDDSVILPRNAFTRVGYQFAGWATSPFGEVVYADEATYVMGPNTSYTLYARWTPNQNVIVFHPNGGLGSMPNQYMETDASATLNKNTFYLTGYHFVGWATSASGGVVYTEAASYRMGTDATYTLYAKWAPNENKLAFDANGGNGAMSDMLIATDAKVTLSANAFAREGYQFVGWATSSGGKVVYENGATYQMGTGSSYTLYACWELLSYTVTVSRTNASVKLMVDSVAYDNPSTVSVPYGSKITVTYSSHFSNYATLECTLDGTPISSGYVGTMPAKAITIRASSTERTSSGGGGGSCLAEGTLITLSDGRRVPIETVKVGDKVVAFDHATGSFVEREVAFVFFANAETEIAELTFSNGAALTIVNTTGHGLFNATLGQYVLVTPGNVDRFVGDHFVWMNGNGELETAELVSCSRYEGRINRYDVVTAGAFNCIANDFLVCSDVLVDICNTFAFTSKFTYDEQKMQDDVATYGLYTYDEWRKYMTEEEFEAFGGAYFKIAVGKGLITKNDIFMLLWFLHSWNG